MVTTKVKQIAHFIRNGSDNVQFKTDSLGDGMWLLVASSPDYGLICEFVGRNGTRDEESDDLYGEFDEAWNEAWDYLYRTPKLWPWLVKRWIKSKLFTPKYGGGGRRDRG